VDRHSPEQPRLLDAPATAEDHLTGSVERVTFHNEENGFSVLRVQVRGRRELVTVVGHAAAIAPGEFVQAGGSWTNDRVHGVQFAATSLKTVAPTTIEGIEKYLGSGLVKGIGSHFAKRLVHALMGTGHVAVQGHRDSEP
jgi:exodeoxyribonuclease V alpha subunit